MANPVLVEVLRGVVIESRHRGAVCVVDADGKRVLEIGDMARPVFPRSAVKSIQALPLIESGAADAFGFGEKELALACASHNGEAAHADLALSMLTRAGLGADALECGTHWPMYQEATIELARSGGEPSGLHNNCSGKHSGFVCTCVHSGIDPTGYVGRGHWLQEAVREAMESVTGAAHGEDVCGTDGCSIPTYAIPLNNLALGFARMATGVGLGAERAKAAKRLFAACMAQPFFTAGSGRADTALMEAAPGRMFVKVGAEGVYCAAIPELGLGIALKVDDGASRAAEVAVATLLAKLIGADGELAEKLGKISDPVLANWNGIDVASLRPTEALR